MKVIKVEILPAKDGEVVTAVITQETKKGGAWKEDSKETVYSGTPEASRSILLDDDDRITIEGKVEAEVVLDKEQMSAKTVFRGDRLKEQEKKDKEQAEKFEKMQKDEKEQLERDKPQEAKLREEQAKARDEAIMGKKPDEKDEPSKPKGRVDYGEPEDKEAGLREEVPFDSKNVKNEGHTTKPKR